MFHYCNRKQTKTGHWFGTSCTRQRQQRGETTWDPIWHRCPTIQRTPYPNTPQLAWRDKSLGTSEDAIEKSKPRCPVFKEGAHVAERKTPLGHTKSVCTLNRGNAYLTMQSRVDSCPSATHPRCMGRPEKEHQEVTLWARQDSKPTTSADEHTVWPEVLMAPHCLFLLFWPSLTPKGSARDCPLVGKQCDILYPDSGGLANYSPGRHLFHSHPFFRNFWWSMAFSFLIQEFVCTWMPVCIPLPTFHSIFSPSLSVHLWGNTWAPHQNGQWAPEKQLSWENKEKDITRELAADGLPCWQSGLSILPYPVHPPHTFRSSIVSGCQSSHPDM